MDSYFSHIIFVNLFNPYILEKIYNQINFNDQVSKIEKTFFNVRCICYRSANLKFYFQRISSMKFV